MIEDFYEYALSNYDNSKRVTAHQFKQDCYRFQHVNSLFTRYYSKEESDVRLLLNHIIILYNIFNTQACTKMLFFKVKPKYWHGLKTILTFLNYMPSQVESIYDSDLPLDYPMVQKLRDI